MKAIADETVRVESERPSVKKDRNREREFEKRETTLSQEQDRKVVKPGVYFAPVDGEGVVMDLVANRYLGLTAASAQMWQGFQDGLPLEEIAAKLAERQLVPRSDVLAVLREQVDAWAQAGIAVVDQVRPEDCPQSKPRRVPAETGVYDDRLRVTRVSLFSCLSLIRAAAWIRWTFRTRGLSHTLRRLQNVSIESVERANFDERIRLTISSYVWLRRSVAQGRQDCLLRSLTLAAALRRMGVDADVCFGVQKLPFVAHAWVEVGGVAMNETERVLRPLSVLARF